MIHMGKAGRFLVIVVAIGVGTASLVNTLADDTDVRKEAEAVGCPRGCPKATSVAYERTPFYEKVSYAVPEGTITVRCTRAAIFVGPYSCAKE